MGLPTTQRAYNLLEEKWMPVLYCNGKPGRVGILQALTDAHKIRKIAASNPMDRVALLRFLLAILMWCKEDAKLSLATLDGKSPGIPENWLNKLKENRAAFCLLGNAKRFYQDESVKGKQSRPIGDLLVEFPGADSVNHMRHVVYDSSCGFCPACCAMGILRLSVWAPANGFYPASVNPGTAAYAFIGGKNLLQTFRKNLPEPDLQTDKAPWLGNERPSSPDAIARLGWRPRKLWLNVGSKKGSCVNCGSFDDLVTSLCNKGGWPTPTTSSQNFAKALEKEFKQLGYNTKEKDQANNNAKKIVKMASLIRKCRMDDLRKACCQIDPQPQMARPTTQTDEQEIARLFHQLISKNNKSAQEAIKTLAKKPNEDEQRTLGSGDMRVKKFWDTDPHLLRDDETISLPGLGADVGVHSSQFWRDALRLQVVQAGKVSAIGPVVNKFTFQDAVSIALPDASDDIKIRANLSADCGDKLQDLIKQITQNPMQKHTEIDASVKLLRPNAEAQIRDRLSRINAFTGDKANEYKAFLYEVYAPVVEQVIASVTPGSPLHRHDMRKFAQALLNKKIKELVENPNPLSNSAKPGSISEKNKNANTRRETPNEPNR